MNAPLRVPTSTRTLAIVDSGPPGGVLCQCQEHYFPKPPPAELVPSCAAGGVLGMLPGIIGSLQALEVAKLILGCGEPLIGRLLTFDGLRGTFRELRVNKDAHCAICGAGSTLKSPRADVVPSPNTCAAPPADPATVPGITVEEFAGSLQHDRAVQLLDVREASEYAIAQIPGAILIPLGELPARLSELDASSAYVVTCYHGGRSRQACALLREAGFAHLRFLEGGIDAWAERIDRSMQRY